MGELWDGEKGEEAGTCNPVQALEEKGPLSLSIMDLPAPPGKEMQMLPRGILGLLIQVAMAEEMRGVVCVCVWRGTTRLFVPSVLMLKPP